MLSLSIKTRVVRKWVMWSLYWDACNHNSKLLNDEQVRLEVCRMVAANQAESGYSRFLRGLGFSMKDFVAIILLVRVLLLPNEFRYFRRIFVTRKMIQAMLYPVTPFSKIFSSTLFVSFCSATYFCVHGSILHRMVVLRRGKPMMETSP